METLIKTLKDTKTGNNVLPRTRSKAVTMEDGTNLDDRLSNFYEQLTNHTADNITTHKVSRGTSNFKGNSNEITIPHGLSVTPVSAYAFPTINPQGYLGEVWIRMDEINLYIGNTGSYTGAMCWVAIG